MGRVVTYECDECGCEVIVTETAETDLSPLFCCGNELTEVSAARKKAAKPMKKTSAKETKKPLKKAPKAVAKKVVTKKKLVSKKRALAR